MGGGVTVDDVLLLPTPFSDSSPLFISVFFFSNIVGDGGGAGAGLRGWGGIFSDVEPPKLTEDDIKLDDGDISAG